MKRFFFSAIVLLAAVACTREPVMPEEPDDKLNGPIEVTLIANSSETRTELGYNNGLLKPYWSTGDAISVVRVPNFQADESFEDWDNLYHLFSGNVVDEPSLSAQFNGSVGLAGQFRAIYPNQEIEWGDARSWYLDYTWTDDDLQVPYIEFYIPSIQEPTPTSFDKRADLLVSAPFEIEAGDHGLGDEVSEIPISFTRANAILKIKLNPQGGLLTDLQGQTVKKVIVGEYSEMGGGEVDLAVARTRAYYTDGRDNYYGLTGKVCYQIPFIDDHSNAVDIYQPGEWGMQNFAVAQYTDGQDGTAYDILSKDDKIATYLIVAPSILMNEDEYEWVEGEGNVPTGEKIGLHIQVETDNYLIDRNVVLPSDGIALQPSVVTTLNIKLYDDGVNKTTVRKKRIDFEESDKTIFPSSVSPDYCWAELVLNSSDMEFDSEILDDDCWSFSEDGIAWVDTESASFDYNWVYDEESGTEKKVYCVSGIYVVGSDVGETTLTVNYKGYVASCNVHVIGLDDELAQPIVFDDPVVKNICLSAGWGNHFIQGEITLYEAAKVTTLINQNDWKSYFRENTEIQYFDELEYFTGLTTIEYNAFDGCSNLKSIKLPKSITVIGGDTGYAFRNCSNLSSVDLSECTALYRIGESAFENCSSLTSITVPASVLYIASDAFRNCTALTTVNIPLNSKLESIYGVDDYWTGAHGAFYGCSALQSIWLPPTLKKIDIYAFKGCSNLSSINLPDGLTKLSSYAFDGCESLESITIPGKIKEISDYTFRYCRSLSVVSMPEGLTSIGRFAFYYCTGLHEIEFPASLATIGYYRYENLIFEGVEFRSGTDNEGVTYHGVKFKGSTPPSFEKDDTVISGKHWDETANDGEGGWVAGVTIYVPRGSKAAYEAVFNITNNGQNEIVEFD